MRCLALADELRSRGVQSRFLCREVTVSLATMIGAHGHALERLGAPTGGAPAGSPEQDAGAARPRIAAQDCDWLVVDHYQLDAEWERAMRPPSGRLMVIDDLLHRGHECDLLLDQNLQAHRAEARVARVPSHCRVLLGPRYALLRPEFAARRATVQPRSGAVRRILVFLGGVDAGNYTGLALEALQKLGSVDLHVDVIIGAEHPHRMTIERTCREAHWDLHVQTERVADLMAAADLAVGAGGSATWERCCLGLPTLVLITADNQRAPACAAALAGVLCIAQATTDPGQLAAELRALIDAPLQRAAQSRAALAQVDGRGTARVARAMGAVGVAIRLAGTADGRHLFEWRNDASIRAMSRDPRPLEWPAHERWFAGVLHDPARILLIGERAGQAAGVIRFDVSGASAEVSIYAVPGRDARVRGADLLAAAEDWLARHRPEVRELRAEVLGVNAASHGLFAGAGYERAGGIYTKRVN